MAGLVNAGSEDVQRSRVQPVCDHFAVVGLDAVELTQQLKDYTLAETFGGDEETKNVRGRARSGSFTITPTKREGRSGSLGGNSPTLSEVTAANDAASRINVFDTVFKGHVQQRYPPEQISPVEGESDSATTPFPSGLPLFCLPNGFKFLRQAPVPSFFTFVSTGAQGEHVYGHCLTMYDPISPAVHAVLQAAEVDGLIPSNDSDARGGEAGARRRSSSKGRHHRGSRGRRGSRGSSVQQIFVPKCLCLVTRYPFINQCRDILSSLFRLVLSPLEVPIERYICNLMNEVPMPPSGKAKILYSIADKELIFTRPPINRPIENVDLPFAKAFQCLGVQTTIKLFQCMLLEQQILFHSSQLSLLAAVSECMMSLMYPFAWEHVYIPVLPQALLGVLNAPMPFVIGMSSDLLKVAIENEIPESLVIIDIDNDQIHVPQDSVSFDAPLPDKEEQKLVKALETIAGPAQRNRGGGDEDYWRTVCLANLDSAYSFAPSPDIFDDGKADEAQDWYKLRLAFLRFFVAMLRDYGKYVTAIDGKMGAGSSSQKEFNADLFLGAQRESSRVFLSAFTSTQCFTKFMDDCVHENQEDPNYDVKFFNESIAEKKNRSFLTFRKLSTPFLQSVKHEVKKTVVCFAPDKANLPQPPPETNLTFEGNMTMSQQTSYTYQYSGFPVLDPALYIEPRPLPDMPMDPKTASSSARKKNAGFWLTHSGDTKVLGFDATVYCVWFLTVAAIGMPNVKERAASPGAPSVEVQDNSVKRRRKRLRRLGAAFDILDRMKRDEIARDELIYRALIDASGRSGSTHHAGLVLGHMKEDGLKPDSVFFSCLVGAFSMDTTLPTVGALPTGLMDAWEDNMRGKQGGDLAREDSVGSAFGGGPSPAKIAASKTRDTLTSMWGSLGGGKKASKRISRSPEEESKTGAQAQSPDDQGQSLDQEDNGQQTPGRHSKLSITLPQSNDYNPLVPPLTPVSSMISPRGTGYSVIEKVFPSLVIDTSRETCPACNTQLSLEDVWQGFAVYDPNDYTTHCPDVKCGRRFVARFTVHSSVDDWVGTMGPNAPLFFEALSPWGLQKEVRTILINSGGVALTSAESFRLSSPTIFWNLVLYFREFCLPLDFLVLQDEREMLIKGFENEAAAEGFASVGDVRPGGPHIGSGEGGQSPSLKSLEEADHRLHKIMLKIGPNWRYRAQGSPQVAAVVAASKARVKLDAVLGKVDSIPAEELGLEIDLAVAHVDVADAVIKQCLEIAVEDAAALVIAQITETKGRELKHTSDEAAQKPEKETPSQEPAETHEEEASSEEQQEKCEEGAAAEAPVKKPEEEAISQEKVEKPEQEPASPSADKGVSVNGDE